MSPRVGDTIGDYRIDGVLGQGGMGQVFRVRNLISDREEAMKVVLPDLSAQPEIADRFLREIKVHASLDHPNIAQFRTALRIENCLVMIMELVEGCGLDEKLRAGPVSLREAISYTGQVLEALSVAHARGIVHRDIKPPNIIITPAGMVKLTDFGIARSARDPRLTLAGAALGSLYYMSPEQLSSQPVDARSDLYSLGVTLYEMVAGTRPFDGENEFAIMNAHLSQTPAPPAGAPSDLSAVILKSLAKNPADRFQTAREFRTALGISGTITAPQGPQQWDPALLESMQQKLAAYIGPIAKVVVTRTARKVHTPQELRRALADEIPSERDRAAFLASL